MAVSVCLIIAFYTATGSRTLCGRVNQNDRGQR